jgi:nucleotide-binding universal stress UspA family protein
MTIVCGTDLVGKSSALAAAAIAARLGTPLHLVHVAELPQLLEEGAARDAVLGQLREKLNIWAEELGRRFSVQVCPLLEQGPPEDRLIAVLEATQAAMLVVSSLGERKQRRWLLGSVAERVAQGSPVPTLIVRDHQVIEEWARGVRPLVVMVGVEPTVASRTALEWVCGLRAVGPCSLTVVQIVWPAEQSKYLGGSAPIPLDHLRPEVEHTLERELREWAGDQGRPGESSFVVKAGWGRVDRHLTQLAADAHADLLVVGTHQRAGLAKLWQGSVSRGVLHGAPMSAACVPARAPVEKSTFH